MLKTCQRCHKSYTAGRRDINSKYCPACRPIVRREVALRTYYKSIGKDLPTRDQSWFDREWANWKKDFAAGKTRSNLKA